MSMVVQNAIRETRLANVVAGDATNDTFYYYFPMLHFKQSATTFEWTAGGTGTVTVTIEASATPIQYAATPGSESTLVYRDITNAVFGVASFTDDFVALDDVGQLSAFTWVRVKVVTLTTDAASAWELYVRQSA